MHNVSIETLASGIEETSVQGVASIPGGTELLVAVGDDSGFTFASESALGTSPATDWVTPIWATSTDVDYAGNVPKTVVRVGSNAGTPQAAISYDGGATWNIDYGASDTTVGGTVAVSAGGDVVLWSTSSQGVLRSQYTGTFTLVPSLPSTALIASDKRNESFFYAGYGSTFYVSSDTGATFQKAGALTGATQLNYIVVHPAIAGQVYVSTDVGIFKSTNYGASFSQITAAVADVQQISLGVAPGSSWYLYAFGTGPSGNKLYGSADDGLSWTDIQGSQGFGSISSGKLVGSSNVAGLVYVGTNGRGVFYAEVTITASGGGGSSSSSTKSVNTKTTTTTTPTTSTTTTSKVVTTTTTSKSLTTTTATSHTSSKTTLTTILTTTTAKTTTSAKPTTSAPSCTVAEYGQCGGTGYSGCTVCASPYTCKVQNSYYYQCV